VQKRESSKLGRALVSGAKLMLADAKREIALPCYTLPGPVVVKGPQYMVFRGGWVPHLSRPAHLVLRYGFGRWR